MLRLSINLSDLYRVSSSTSGVRKEEKSPPPFSAVDMWGRGLFSNMRNVHAAVIQTYLKYKPLADNITSFYLHIITLA